MTGDRCRASRAAVEGSRVAGVPSIDQWPQSARDGQSPSLARMFGRLCGRKRHADALQGAAEAKGLGIRDR